MPCTCTSHHVSNSHYKTFGSLFCLILSLILSCAWICHYLSPTLHSLIRVEFRLELSYQFHIGTYSLFPMYYSLSNDSFQIELWIPERNQQQWLSPVMLSDQDAKCTVSICKGLMSSSLFYPFRFLCQRVFIIFSWEIFQVHGILKLSVGSEKTSKV